MSYTIFYNKQFIKVSENQFIPLIESGDNNVYEAYGSGRKRARNWHINQWVAPNLIASKEEILGYVEQYRNDVIKSSEKAVKEYNDESYSYSDKTFGYHTGLALYGKGTNKTTFGLFKSFFETGINQALTIEELKNYQADVSVNVYFYSEENHKKKGLEIKPSVIIQSTEHLIETLNEWRNYYKDYLQAIYITIDEFGIEKIKRERSKQRKNNQKTKEYVTTHKFYVLDCIDAPGFFVRNTARGFKYSYHYTSAKKFLEKKQANKFFEKMRNKDRFKVKLIDLGDFQTVTIQK